MSIQKLTKLKNRLEIAGFVAVLILTYICIYPLENHYSKIISNNTIPIMLVLFLAGFVSIILKFNNSLIYCWLCCTALCHHLKDTQVNHFYYTKADSKKTNIQVAHYDLDSNCNLSNFSKKINSIKSSILSLRLDNCLVNDSTINQLKQIYPHHFFCDLNKIDNKSRCIFSNYKIDTLKTFNWNDESLLLGVINFNGTSEKLYFLNLSLNENDVEDKDSTIYHLNNFTSSCKEYIKNEAVIAFGDTPYYHWHPEIREFRNKSRMKDSRLDLELNLNRKHIFYSLHLDCIHFEQDDNGVIGVYQLNETSKRYPQKEIISLSH